MTRRLLAATLVWALIGGGWSWAMAQEAEAVPDSAPGEEAAAEETKNLQRGLAEELSDALGGRAAAEETKKLQRELAAKEAQVEVLRERLEELETRLKVQIVTARQAAARVHALEAQERAARAQKKALEAAADAAERSARASTGGVNRTRTTARRRSATTGSSSGVARPVRDVTATRAEAAESALTQTAPEPNPSPALPPSALGLSGSTDSSAATLGFPSHAAGGTSSLRALPDAASDSASPGIELDRMIDRAAGLRKQAIRAKLRGDDAGARLLWLQADELSRRIERMMQTSPGGTGPQTPGTALRPPAPSTPPAPAVAPRRLPRVARPATKSSRPARLPRVTATSESRRTPRAGRAAPEPRRLQRARGRSTGSTRARSADTKVWSEIDQLRDEVRELRELLEKALRETKTRATEGEPRSEAAF